MASDREIAAPVPTNDRLEDPWKFCTGCDFSDYTTEARIVADLAFLIKCSRCHVANYCTPACAVRRITSASFPDALEAQDWHDHEEACDANLTAQHVRVLPPTPAPSQPPPASAPALVVSAPDPACFKTLLLLYIEMVRPEITIILRHALRLGRPDSLGLTHVLCVLVDPVPNIALSSNTTLLSPDKLRSQFRLYFAMTLAKGERIIMPGGWELRPGIGELVVVPEWTPAGVLVTPVLVVARVPSHAVTPSNVLGSTFPILNYIYIPVTFKFNSLDWSCSQFALTQGRVVNDWVSLLRQWTEGPKKTFEELRKADHEASAADLARVEWRGWHGRFAF